MKKRAKNNKKKGPLKIPFVGKELVVVPRNCYNTITWKDNTVFSAKLTFRRATTKKYCGIVYQFENFQDGMSYYVNSEDFEYDGLVKHLNDGAITGMWTFYKAPGRQFYIKLLD